MYHIVGIFSSTFWDFYENIQLNVPKSDHFADDSDDCRECFVELRGVSRARHWAAPVNAARFPGETPCRRLGKCGDCISPDCICNQLLITRHCRPAGRIKFILVGEDLGL